MSACCTGMYRFGASRCSRLSGGRRFCHCTNRTSFFWIEYYPVIITRHTPFVINGLTLPPILIPTPSGARLADEGAVGSNPTLCAPKGWAAQQQADSPACPPMCLKPLRGLSNSYPQINLPPDRRVLHPWAGAQLSNANMLREMGG